MSFLVFMWKFWIPIPRRYPRLLLYSATVPLEDFLLSAPTPKSIPCPTPGSYDLVTRPQDGRLAFAFSNILSPTLNQPTALKNNIINACAAWGRAAFLVWRPALRSAVIISEVLQDKVQHRLRTTHECVYLSECKLKLLRPKKSVTYLNWPRFPFIPLTSTQCMDWTLVTPTFLCWNPNPQCDSIRRQQGPRNGTGVLTVTRRWGDGRQSARKHVRPNTDLCAPGSRPPSLQRVRTKRLLLGSLPGVPLPHGCLNWAIHSGCDSEHRSRPRC